MSITTLLGLSFGVFPCLLFGFIMLLSLIVCEYIEEYVAKHLCAWKNRRRRGFRSFYRDFRERRSGAGHHSPYGGGPVPGGPIPPQYPQPPHLQHLRSRGGYASGPIPVPGPEAWLDPDIDNDEDVDAFEEMTDSRLIPVHYGPSAPVPERHYGLHHGGQGHSRVHAGPSHQSQYPVNPMYSNYNYVYAANDPPPSYEECILPSRPRSMPTATPSSSTSTSPQSQSSRLKPSTSTSKRHQMPSPSTDKKD